MSACELKESLDFVLNFQQEEKPTILIVDDEENNFVKLNDRTYVFEGKTKLVDLSRHLMLDDDYFDDVEDADTLAGLLLELKGDFPSVHESFDYKGMTLEILKKEQRRISRVKITKKNIKG